MAAATYKIAFHSVKKLCCLLFLTLKLLPNIFFQLSVQQFCFAAAYFALLEIYDAHHSLTLWFYIAQTHACI